MKEWEYDARKINVINLPHQMKDLEELGDEGWELVWIRDDIDENGEATAILKRPKS
ncbi:conserved hypothetical protein [Methanosalsum zhilinae DSM 4017]|uniref:DUF4177 domain-containing protein n=1 Tax=Methanosalsum zhilinae (strain DSM 4017 / NBRC 107636 / OCM 62 / WeN5) TaxID=679901 RepID=F7XKW2_METZD|nr:hypothetical protein [Methanosalsum zhilinae]AEH61833.1 conserved hypothetical protein [Methanosalsum zhilinae DSM 4017]